MPRGGGTLASGRGGLRRWSRWPLVAARASAAVIAGFEPVDEIDGAASGRARTIPSVCASAGRSGCPRGAARAARAPPAATEGDCALTERQTDDPHRGNEPRPECRKGARDFALKQIGRFRPLANGVRETRSQAFD